MKIAAKIGALILSAGVAFSQTPEEVIPIFESADVHVSPHIPNQSVRGPILRGTRYEIHYATMVDLISIAYEIESEKVSGGPNWMEWDQFDIIAKTPEGTTPATARTMLRALLNERFKLSLHNDEKAVPVYALTVLKSGAKLKQSDGAATSNCESKQQPRDAAPGTNEVACMTMAQFAERLPSLAPGFVDHLVVDQTKLEGTWDFSVSWTAQPFFQGGPGARTDAAADPNGNITMLEAIDKQLGLKLEPQKSPMEVLVVDHVEQKPSEN